MNITLSKIRVPILNVNMAITFNATVIMLIIMMVPTFFISSTSLSAEIQVRIFNVFVGHFIVGLHCKMPVSYINPDLF